MDDHAVDATCKQPQKIYGDEIIDWNQEDWKEIMPSIMCWDHLSHEAFRFDHKLQRCKSLSLDRMKKYYIDYVEPPPPIFVFGATPEIKYRAIDWQ